MANHKLFEIFPPISNEEWRAKIETDLKGADFDRKLVWRTIEGFNVQPYYRQDDLENKPLTDLKPNEFPYVRGQKTNDNDWLVRQDFLVEDAKEANKSILDALMKGITSVNLIFEEPILQSQADFDRLMKGIEPTAIEINFFAQAFTPKLMKMLAQYIETNHIDVTKVSGSFNIDPFARLLTEGNFPHQSIEEAYEVMAELIQFASEKLPNFHVVGVNGRIFPNAGSSIVQELAYALSMANLYLAELSEKLSVDTVAKHMRFNMGISSNYFMEIAKVRALRYMWSKLVEAYQPKDIEVAKVFVHAENAGWNKTIFDPYVNMLRTTTEAMSAVLGGVDSMTVNPFDTTYKVSDNFSKRIARNTQSLLKEEAHFDKVVDPAAGSYYIEELTQNLIEKAWELVLEVDEQGGFYKAISEGTVQNNIAEKAQQRDMFIATRREILLGTNQYPNTTETMNDKIELLPAASESKDVLIQPLKMYRGAYAFEEMRLRTERAEKTPEVFMFTYGNLAMRRARSQFAGNFFGCAGYKITDNNGFATVEEGVAKVKEVKPEVVVVCSSDDEYANIVPQIYDEVGKDAIVVVAGNPKESIEELKAKGIEYFIHVKSNVLETLLEFNDRLF